MDALIQDSPLAKMQVTKIEIAERVKRHPPALCVPEDH